MLSIITIAYNNLDGLKKTHASIQSQTTQEYEWIVVDGGSKDKTSTFLKTTNANWKSEPDGGIYDAMNKGIDRMKGDYMLFLNSGDCFADQDSLGHILETIHQNPAFIYGDALEQEENGLIREKIAKPYTTISKGLFTHHQAMVYKKNDLRYDTQYKIASDYDFTYRYLMEIVSLDLPVHYIPTPLCIFEGGGISQTSAKKGRLEQYKIRKSHHIKGAKRLYCAQTLIWKFRMLFPNLFWGLKGVIRR
jgi:putative colanic acid biosynthesis glycosyltransferase